MRRENRRRIQHSKSTLDKTILYVGIGVVILGIIIFSLLMYSKDLNEDMKKSTMDLEKIASISDNNTQNTESASIDIGKTVEESKNEINNTTANQTNTSTQNKVNTNANTDKNTTTLNTTTNTAKTNTINNTQTETKKEEKQVKELNFAKPVEGDIVREYAKDNLIYSNTLDEWTTHTGIDIKAEKTTVVKSAEEGTVKSIKNDPRYGLTIVIEHENGFQSVYSNLLTSEFVVEGEKVEKGQSIGTVGNTAVFEIADEPHLHFEILKDSLPVDPSIYIK